MQGRLQLQRAVDVEWQYVWVGEFWGAGVFLDRRGIDEQPYFGAYLVHLLILEMLRECVRLPLEHVRRILPYHKIATWL